MLHVEHGALFWRSGLYPGLGGSLREWRGVWENAPRGAFASGPGSLPRVEHSLTLAFEPLDSLKSHLDILYSNEAGVGHAFHFVFD
jgi:hypothetical protein